MADNKTEYACRLVAATVDAAVKSGAPKRTAAAMVAAVAQALAPGPRPAMPCQRADVPSEGLAQTTTRAARRRQRRLRKDQGDSMGQRDARASNIAVPSEASPALAAVHAIQAVAAAAIDETMPEAVGCLAGTCAGESKSLAGAVVPVAGSVPALDATPPPRRAVSMAGAEVVRTMELTPENLDKLDGVSNIRSNGNQEWNSEGSVARSDQVRGLLGLPRGSTGPSAASSGGGDG